MRKSKPRFSRNFSYFILLSDWKNYLRKNIYVSVMNSKTLIRMSLALCVIAIIGYLFSVLSLLDIYQNIEPDLTLEWNVVRAGFLFFLMYFVISGITILKMKKSSGQ